MEKKVLELVVKTKSAEKNIKGLNTDLSKTEKQVKKTGNEMNSAFDALPSSIQGVANKVKGLGTSFKALAVGGGVAAIAGLGTLFVTATKKGAEFAKELSGLKAVLGASDSEMQQLSSSAKELGASTQFTAKEVVGLQTEFAKLGFTTKEILKSTKATLNLAASLDVGLAEAASIAGSTLRAFGLEAEETQRVVDVMAASTSKSALDYDSLRESLKLVAPTARAMNVDIEETTALLATLADNGLKGSIAGTGLSKTFIELNKKGIPLNDALQKVKESSNQLNTAIDLVGVVGSKSLLTLANNAPKIDVLTRSFENSQGAAQRLAETRLDNLAGDTTKLGSAWEGFLLSIEDGEGIFNSIARGIVQATTSLLNFITPTEKVSDALKSERLELFKVEAELRNVNTSQEDRVKIIKELQDKYPNYLKNIDAETASNEDLNRAIQEINKSLINKILIQEREEEINEQAEETANDLNKVLEKEAEVLEFSAELRQKYSDLGIQIKATSPNEILKELNEISERENKLRLEGNNQNKLKASQLSKLGKEQDSLFFKIKALNNAEQNFQEEQEKGNDLIREKDALMERLGITTAEEIETKKEDAQETVVLVEKTKDLIKIQEELLEKAKELPQTTERELVVKNRKIATIEKEIKRLKSLGVEQKKATTTQKEELGFLKIRNAETVDANNQLAENTNTTLSTLATINANYYQGLRDQRQQDLDDFLRINEAKRRSQEQLTQATSGALRSFVQLAGEGTKAGKAAALADVFINTASGISSAISGATAAAATTGPGAPIMTPILIAQLVGQVLGGMAAAKNILQKVKGPSASVPSSVSTGGAGGAGSRPPQFNIVGNSGVNQIANAVGGQGPVQAFVVAGAVTTQQQLNNAIVSRATL